jgi:hypothetical protein
MEAKSAVIEWYQMLRGPRVNNRWGDHRRFQRVLPSDSKHWRYRDIHVVFHSHDETRVSVMLQHRKRISQIVVVDFGLTGSEEYWLEHKPVLESIAGGVQEAFAQADGMEPALKQVMKNLKPYMLHPRLYVDVDRVHTLRAMVASPKVKEAMQRSTNQRVPPTKAIYLPSPKVPQPPVDNNNHPSLGSAPLSR